MQSHVIINSAVLLSMVERLREDSKVFKHYGYLHRSKGTDEGNTKATANDDHASKIDLILREFLDTYPQEYCPCTEIVNHTIDSGVDRGHNPCALILSRAFLGLWWHELNQDRTGDFGTMADMIGSQWAGLTIYLAEDNCVSGVIACGEGSVVLEKARAAYA